jgi:uncharacterized RDD family membrane protein YckC
MVAETKPPALEAVNQQGHYAGAMTRLAAFVIDQAIVGVVYSLTWALATFTWNLVTRGELEVELPPVVFGISYAIWWWVYFAYPWAVSGKTFGMAVLGIRVVRADGSDLRGRDAALRALTLPLGFLTLGLGFLGIVVGRQRRALYDRIAGTCVVYFWDAQAARLRFLAKQGSERVE